MHFKTYFLKSILLKWLLHCVSKVDSESYLVMVQCVDKDLEVLDSHPHMPVVYIFYTKTNLLVLCVK